MKKILYKIKKLLLINLTKESGQSMVEYILIFFLIGVWVLRLAKAFGIALDLAFVSAIKNIAFTIK